MKTPQPVRGMQSLLGEEADRMAAVVAAFDKVRRLYGFRRVDVPMLEDTAVFARTMGETTDVVSKEMYSFEDKSGDPVTLRPEFTAGIARAFLSEGWQQHVPLKVATHGAAFRYERPQKGRFRQFHQLDAEIIGAPEPASDVELLCFADQLLKELGIDAAVLKLNTLGDPDTRAAWRDALHAHFTKHRGDLSEESRDRLDRNPLRILDSKAHADWPIVDAAPVIDDFLTSDAGEFFARVTAGLDAAGVNWERAPRLVRGLDYYRHTAFEFMTDQLGAQGTVLAGGRYDGLMESLGGPHTPAVGWAAGIERLSMLIDAPAVEQPLVVIVPLGDRAATAAEGIIAGLRRDGIASDMAYRGNMKKRMSKANASGATYALIIGDDELDRGEAQLKTLASGEQRAVTLGQLAQAIAE
ncbi:histidine--tRNA ligase [Sphingomonas sabuli]|uniref:Histidine--tRNA ligase n=1 Tax=Sphingomonas sabuli TaxID=2764186 RepID=A0A7G9KZZ3_9SPHN|nr:histidine--tRNA ligase [Sphingomonas sabuli]QNM81942.1 histidine--tRNA ligase [Sphingomonas sabuli]